MVTSSCSLIVSTELGVQSAISLTLTSSWPLVKPGFDVVLVMDKA